MCAGRHAESDFGQAGLDREAGQPAMAVDDEQDSATGLVGGVATAVLVGIPRRSLKPEEKLDVLGLMTP